MLWIKCTNQELWNVVPGLDGYYKELTILPSSIWYFWVTGGLPRAIYDSKRVKKKGKPNVGEDGSVVRTWGYKMVTGSKPEAGGTPEGGGERAELPEYASSFKNRRLRRPPKFHTDPHPSLWNTVGNNDSFFTPMDKLFKARFSN